MRSAGPVRRTSTKRGRGRPFLVQALYARKMRRVLIADDSLVARVAVCGRVRAVGIEVVEEASAAGARAVDPTSLACALLDLDLGDGYGTEVAETFRASGATIPIAFFTSTTTGDALTRAASLGPVFNKPDDIEAAVAWVMNHGLRA